MSWLVPTTDQVFPPSIDLRSPTPASESPEALGSPVPVTVVRPREAVFRVDYVLPPDQLEVGRRLVAEYHIQKLTSCSTCHR
jgi:hypothetical protein